MLDFKMNQVYIASTLCINRDNPNSSCHGKCYLKKNLQKDEGDGTNKQASSRERFEINWYYEGETTNETFHKIQLKYPDQVIVNLNSTQLSQVFHPPGNA